MFSSGLKGSEKEDMTFKVSWVLDIHHLLEIQKCWKSL
jgi:hypothetical protein